MANTNQLNLSMTPAYLFAFLLLTQQFLCIHSYLVLPSNEDQNQLANFPLNQARQLLSKYLANSESSSDDADFQARVPSTLQRRFCCMSPLSGRKRFIRSLLRQQEK